MKELRTHDLLEVVEALTQEMIPVVVELPRLGNLVSNALELLERAQSAGLIPPPGVPTRLEHLYEEDYFKRRDEAADSRR